MDNTPNYANSPIEQKPSRKKTIWLVLVILALIASNTGWALFYLKQQGELTAQINTLKAQNLKLTKDNKDLQSKDDSVDTTAYREIPELGVKYKVTDTNKNLTYAYKIDENKIPVVLFSTTDIAKIPQDEGDSGKDDIASNFSIGVIYKYSADQLSKFKYIDGDFASYSKEHPDYIKKIGNNTYILESPSGFGSSERNKESAKTFTTLANTFKTITNN